VRPLVIGHRGSRGRGLAENTLEAFDDALRGGADGVELDVRLTRDGVPVVAHDADVRSVNGGGQVSRIAELSARALPRWRGGEAIPTLEAALDLCAGRGVVNVELKADVPDRRALVERSAHAMRRCRRVDMVISSFHPEVVLRVARELPDAPRAILVGARTRRLRVALPLAMARVVEAAHVEDPSLDAARVAWLSRAGLRVVAWTVNDVTRAKELASWGARWIITDDPRALVEAFSPPTTSALAHSQSTRTT
jgi:glycerophosphoryl diester phosphodiesterase